MKVRAETGLPLTSNDARRLVRNIAFQEYVRSCFEEEATRARATMESHMVQVVEDHFEAIQNLKQRGLHEKLHNFTIPYLERVWPKHEGPKLPPTQINIVLGGTFAKQYDALQETPAAEIVSVAEVIEEPM